MRDEQHCIPSAAPPLPIHPYAALAVTIAVLACATYVNLSFAVTDPADYRFFPPFRSFVNANLNREIGGENYQIAKSLVAGDGFANPFKERNGPTAWTAPVLPAVLAAILWASDADRDTVMAVMVAVQVLTLIATALLVLALAQQTTSRIGPWAAAAVFIVAMVRDFHLWFQYPSDGWIVLLALNALLVGWCWWRPFPTNPSLGAGRAGLRQALGWGLLGGGSALISPIVGFAWAMMTLVVACQQRAWRKLSVTLLIASLTVAPWVIRNYLVFGRFIPVKSNLAFELYQSQCLQPDGLLQRTTFATHPHMSAGPARQEYKALGEMAFLDNKMDRFWQAVAADPLSLAKRVAERFVGAAVWYVPLDRSDEAKSLWVLWLWRLIHVLPFVGVLLLCWRSGHEVLHVAQWAVLGIYASYLLPYIGVSYYERYAMPLLGVKVLLVIWGVDCLLKRAPMRAE